MGQLSEGHMYPACTEFILQEINPEIMGVIIEDSWHLPLILSGQKVNSDLECKGTLSRKRR